MNRWAGPSKSSRRSQHRKRRGFANLRLENLEERRVMNATGVNDSGYVVSEDGPILNGSSVLTNDGFTVGPKQVVLFSPISANGATVNVNTDGTFTYNPATSAAAQALAPLQTLSDTFTYVVQDQAETFTPNLVSYGTYTNLANGGTGGGGGLASLDARIAAGLPNASGTTSFVDFNDPSDGNGGHFGPNTEPAGLNTGGADDNYGVVVVGTLRVNTTQFYTFGTLSDDNSRIRIDVNQNRRLATDGSETYALQNGCCTDVTGTPVLLTAGQDYDFQAMYTEGGGGSYGEFYYAAGSQASYAANPGAFMALGNSSGGITIGTKSFSTATVTVTVQGANDGPSAFPDSYTTNENTPLNVVPTVPNLLNYGVWNTGGGTNGDLDAAIAASPNPTRGTGTIALVDFTDDVQGFAATFAGGTVPNGINDGLDNNNYGVRVSGFIQVNNPGSYTFTRNTDDAARIRIDLNRNGIFDANEAIIDVNGNATNSSSAITLAAGQYAIELQYVEGGGGSGGDFYYRLGAGPNALIGDSSQGIAVLSKPGLLGNDVDPEQNTLTVTALNGSAVLTGTSTMGAAVTLNANGSFTYNPTGVAALQALALGQTAVDTFTYRVTEAGGNIQSAPITVSITVTGVSDAENDTYLIGEDGVLTVPTPGVLANDNATEVMSVQGTAMPGSPNTAGDGQVVTTATGGGALTVQDTGGFTYTPGAAFNSLASGEQATVSFSYKIPGSTNQVVTNNFGTNPTLQGWTVINGPVTFVGTDGGGLTPGSGGVAAYDNAHPTMVVQSPTFKLGGTVDGTNALVAVFAGGAGNQSNTPAPLNQAAVLAFNSGNSRNDGQKGLALLNTATNNYDAVIFENDDGGTNTRSFTLAQLQALATSQGKTLNPNATYRLQYYDNDDTSWGWGQLNSVSYSQLTSNTLTGTSTAAAAGTSQGATFTVSDSDLIQGIVPAVTAGSIVFNDATSGGPGNLTNGLFGTAGIGGAEATTIQNNTTLEYTLAAGAPQGYTLSSVSTYASWQDQGREDQRYSLEVQTVSTGATWVPITNVVFNTPTNSGPPSSTRVVVTPTVAGTALAEGVTKVRFVFGTQDNNYAGYRELDVFGTPTTTVPSATATITVIGANDAPSNPTPAAISVPEGGSGTITATATDADTTNVVKFQLDLDGNGTVDVGGPAGVASGTPLTWAQIVAVFPNADGPSSLANSKIRSIDSSGQANNTSAWVPVTITLTNAPPTSASIDPDTVLTAIGIPITFTLSADDPSSEDNAGNFTWGIDWDNNGTVDESPTGLSGDTTVTHTFSTLGDHQVNILTVKDKDGGTLTGTLAIPLAFATVSIDTIVQDQDTGDVFIGGDNAAADRFVINPLADGGVEIVHTLNGHIERTRVFFDDFADPDAARIIVHGNGGADDIRVGSKMTRAVEFYGDAGNDYLAGGSNNDSLFGGADNDRLLGGAGEDVMEGGSGADSLDGGADNDTLYGGQGIDTVLGNNGNDFIFGGDGIDRNLNGGNDDDVIVGDGPNDSTNTVLPAPVQVANSLTGGNGNDILIGGTAADTLVAGYGNDILIGGMGADALNGGQNEDILISGTTSYDDVSFDDNGDGTFSPNSNLTSLLSIMQEWGYGDGLFSERVDNIRNGTGLNTDGTLDSSSVFQDTSKDNLVGSSSLDWFWASLSTDKTDRVAGEKLN